MLNLLYPSLRQNQKCTIDYSSCKKLTNVLNSKAVFSAQVKVRKKDFCNSGRKAAKLPCQSCFKEWSKLLEGHSITTFGYRITEIPTGINTRMFTFLKSPDFSGFYTQLLKNCVHNCDDHSRLT